MPEKQRPRETGNKVGLGIKLGQDTPDVVHPPSCPSDDLSGGIV